VGEGGLQKEELSCWVEPRGGQSGGGARGEGRGGTEATSAVERPRESGIGGTAERGRISPGILLRGMPQVRGVQASP